MSISLVYTFVNTYLQIFLKVYRLDSDPLAGGGDCHPCHAPGGCYAGSCANINRQPVATNQRHGVEIACLLYVGGVCHNVLSALVTFGAGVGRLMLPLAFCYVFCGLDSGVLLFQFLKPFQCYAAFFSGVMLT